MPLNRQITTNILTGLFFLLFYLYFGVMNGYHLMYFEQDQLFRFNWNYFTEFFQKPGGLVAFLNSFLVQFFINPWLAAALVSVVGFVIYFLTWQYLSKIGLKGVVLPIVVLVFLAFSLSSLNSSFLLFTGLMLVFLLLKGYFSVRRDSIRYIIGLALVFPFYYLMGVFSLLLVLMIVIEEIFLEDGKHRFLIPGLYLVLALLSAFISWKVVFFIHPYEAFIYPLDPGGQKSVLMWEMAVLLMMPAILLVAVLFRKLKVELQWSPVFIITGTALVAVSIFVLFRFGYDPRNNKLQKIDCHIQNEDWEDVLKLSREYPGRNQLVMYYTNLALYHTGRMGDQMFYYPQSGTKGLWLEWQRNEVVPYYGGEVFYRLGFSNEAFRWAFEAMEAKGLNPRSLKRLVTTAIINKHYDIARKYLHFLSQTLFYNHWAETYLDKIGNETQLEADHEIASKQDLVPQKDFISYMTPYDIGLFPLLENHPHNKMAFEYMMAAFLLNKNLYGFAENIYRLKELGYSRIPVHFEEAMIIYMGVTKKDIIPDGFTISAGTKERFHNYAQILDMYRNNQEMASKALGKDFGNTFWYYMQFNN